MTANIKNIISVALLLLTCNTFAQVPIKEHLDKTGKEKIAKSITKTMGTFSPFKDGHGKHPYFTSSVQYDTIALLNFYVYSNEAQTKAGNAYYNVTYTSSVSADAGQVLVDSLYKESINKLKDAFRKEGVILLTPDEFLNTEEKINSYNNFVPDLKGVGKIMNNQTTANRASHSCASEYKCNEAILQHDPVKNVVSYGELAKQLGVKAVLGIAIEVINDRKTLSISNTHWRIYGVNPVPIQDKKYVGAGCWAKYQEGLVYFNGNYAYSKRLKIADLRKGKKGKVIHSTENSGRTDVYESTRELYVENENYTGFGELLECFVMATTDRWKQSMEKNKK